MTVLSNKFIPSDFLPIGFLGYLPYTALPAGWLICDGTIYSIADYPELAAKLGNTYGGDGVTTFAVPDDRGLFRRGLDLGKGVDVGRVLGSYQGDDVGPHVHPIKVNPVGNSGSNGRLVGDSGGSPYGGEGVAGILNNIGIETRPKNRAYIPIIKAKNIYYDMTIEGGNAATLGGNPASYYAAASRIVKNTDFSGVFTANGYRKLPDGTMIQWGGSSSGSSGPMTITFPISFTTVCFAVVASHTGNYGMRGLVEAYNATAAQFSLGFIGSTDTWSAVNCYWIAIGR